jgi:hypothetical protein
VPPPAAASCAVHATVMGYARAQRAILTQWLAAVEARLGSDKGGSPSPASPPEAPDKACKRRRR